AIAFMTIPILGSLGIPGSTLFPPPEPPYDAFPYLFLLYLTVTCGWFVVQRLRSPAVVRLMERRIEEIHERFTHPSRVNSLAIEPVEGTVISKQEQED
ncbi:MAG: hypothetical protein SFW36_11325, partial [Leptolyngbyaceae cyanobacterium bins.59]|nr:hypothetical protein [Leptolyngbyaceae cyanobacterium bins.59]